MIGSAVGWPASGRPGISLLIWPGPNNCARHVRLFSSPLQASKSLRYQPCDSFDRQIVLSPPGRAPTDAELAPFPPNAVPQRSTLKGQAWCAPPFSTLRPLPCRVPVHDPPLRLGRAALRFLPVLIAPRCAPSERRIRGATPPGGGPALPARCSRAWALALPPG